MASTPEPGQTAQQGPQPDVGLPNHEPAASTDIAATAPEQLIESGQAPAGDDPLSTAPTVTTQLQANTETPASHQVTMISPTLMLQTGLRKTPPSLLEKTPQPKYYSHRRNH
eukprot:2744166-Amphidinium_carterae.1